MTAKEWDARFMFFYRQLVAKSNNGEYKGTRRDAWMLARRQTEAFAGPRPDDEDGFDVVDVVKAPIGAVKKGVKLMQNVRDALVWLDGKKTTIGAALAVVADVITAVLPQLPMVLELFGVEAAVITTIVGVLGKVLVVIGLVHKHIKYRRTVKAGIIRKIGG